MRTAVLPLLSLPLLAACAGASGQAPATPPPTAEGPCRNEGLDRFIGQTASAEICAGARRAWR